MISLNQKFHLELEFLVKESIIFGKSIMERYKDMDKIKNFESLEALKNDSELMDMDSYSWKKVLLKGKPVYVCTTNQQYEDILWGGTYDMLTEFNQHFQIPEEPSVELCSDVRDFILERMQEQGIELVDVFDEY